MKADMGFNRAAGAPLCKNNAIFSPTRRRLLKAAPALAIAPYFAGRVSVTSAQTGNGYSSLATMESVRANAGITTGVLPGVDYGSVAPGTNASTAAATPIEIRSRADALAVAAEGDGSKAAPFVIRDRNWTGIAGNSFSWIDTEADYYIDLINCNFGEPAIPDVQHVYCEISGFDRSTQVETSRLRVIQSTTVASIDELNGAGQCHVMVERGLLEIIAHKFNGGRFHPVQKTGGADTKLTIQDSEFVGRWRGNIGYITNFGSDGDIDLNRITFGASKPQSGLILAKDCHMLCRQIDVASDRAIGVFLSSSQLVATEDFVLRKIFIDCHFVSKQRILNGKGETDHAWQNMTFVHCDFFGSDDTANVGKKLVVLGPASPSAQSNAQNLIFNSCRFRKRNIGDQVTYAGVSGGSFTIGDTLLGTTSGFTGVIVGDDGSTLTVESTDGRFLVAEIVTDDHGVTAVVNGRPARFQAPGNECIDLYYAKDCTIELCWVDEAGEDAYELHYPREGNVIRYCGGENVHTQMVDIFSNGKLNHASQVLVHDIWGTCGGEGLIITNVDNVEAFSILTDSSQPIKGTVMPNTPQANVVISTSGQNGLPNGCYIHGEISPPSRSARAAPIAEVLTNGARVGGNNSIDNAYWQEQPIISEGPDTDGDGIPDSADNCKRRANPDQCNGDAHLDSFGNRCDADYNNDGIVDDADVEYFQYHFGSANPVTDYDCNGVTDLPDMWSLLNAYGRPPGP